MEDYLTDLYYGLGHSTIYGTAAKLRAQAKKDGKSYSLAEIKDWLLRQDSHTIHKQARFRYPRNRIIVGGIGSYTDCDLNDQKALIKFGNAPYRYILTCLDGLSRKAYVELLKTKSGPEMVEAFKRLFKRMPHPPQNLTSDKGNEFRNALVQQYLKSLNINFFTTENEDIKNSKSERFQRTLQTLLHKHYTAKGNRSYVPIIEKIVTAYNNTKHSTTGVTPNSVTLQNHQKLWRKLYGNDLKLLGKAMTEKAEKNVPLKVGDQVRIVNAKGKFDKAYRGMFSREIFFVTHVLVPKGIGQITVRLKDYKNEPILGRFYLHEVTRVVKRPGLDFHKIDRVLSSRGKGQNRMHLVSFEGYDSSHNAWIPDKDLKKL